MELKSALESTQLGMELQGVLESKQLDKHANEAINKAKDISSNIMGRASGVRKGLFGK
jgi:hypothetical protein